MEKFDIGYQAAISGFLQQTPNGREALRRAGEIVQTHYPTEQGLNGFKPLNCEFSVLNPEAPAGEIIWQKTRDCEDPHCINSDENPRNKAGKSDTVSQPQKGNKPKQR